MLIYKCYFFQCHFAFSTPINAQKVESVPSFFPKAKPFCFSVLMAFCQRNNHFSGCKGTKNFPFLQTIL